MADIARRDFINGTLVTAGALLAPGWLMDCAKRVTEDSPRYPPLLTGLRGSTASAFEAAHQLAWAGKVWSDPADTGEEYDLIVVGAGISGLSAAHFYRKEFGKDAKILIVDNHDDFGGHARRNEFNVSGAMRLCYGGSQSLEDPYSYGRESRQLLRDLKIELGVFERAYNLKFFKSHGLSDVTYFSKEKYGKDVLVPVRLVDNGYTLPGLPAGPLDPLGAVASMPLPDEAKAQLQILLTDSAKTAAEIPKAKRSETSYFAFLKDMGITHPAILEMLRRMSTDETGIPADCLSLSEAMSGDLPGFKRPHKESSDPSELYVHHFPDGNASVARLLVRKLIPEAVTGSSMEDIVMAPLDYGKLDQKGARVRLRLNSTVIRSELEGEEKNAKRVIVTYVNQGKAYLVKSRHCVMACYSAIIPHVVPGLPEKQKADLKHQVKAPFVYSTVVIKNWNSLKKLGIGGAFCPGNFHQVLLAGMPTEIGGYHSPSSPDEPMALTLIGVPIPEKSGLSPKEGFREGRRRLLGMSFDDFENEIKRHLDGMLGPGGFDADRDITAITVNRWGHGYSYVGSNMFDEESTAKIAARARKPYGNIVIANSDAGAMASVDTAMDEAYRAVHELED
ncbi:MAG: NAD(P)/FAD-dependent oxidoreductase [Leptospirales bacterium]|nr:NAD(P)/FAD-dependent oxidoreductase [Leptospirales bacterium]